MVSSFALGIPIFFDTVFYLMIPLARAMGVRIQKSYALYVMAIIAGGTMAHSLVPPTPGPLFAAGALGVSIGLMIIMGTIIGLACSSAGLVYAFWLNKTATYRRAHYGRYICGRTSSLAEQRHHTAAFFFYV